LVASSLCLVFLNGCVVAAIGGAAGGGYALMQTGSSPAAAPPAAAASAYALPAAAPAGYAVAPASFAAAPDGLRIEDRIKARWAAIDPAIAREVAITAFSGRVLLTGAVPLQTVHDAAVAQAWQVDGIEQVMDEIRLDSGATVGPTPADTEIETQLQAALANDRDLTASNYAVRSVQGEVYILGEARDRAELERVGDDARNTPNVWRVRNYVRIRRDAGVPPAGAAVEANPPPGPTPAS
jgi:osmotically-inducible protein OsmY